MANHKDILDQISKDHTGKNFHEILGANSNTIETIVHKAIDKIVSASTKEIKESVRIVEIPQIVEKIVEKIVYVEVEKKSDAEIKNSATKTKAEPKPTQSPLKVASKPTQSPLKSNQKPVKPTKKGK